MRETRLERGPSYNCKMRIIIIVKLKWKRLDVKLKYMHIKLNP
jgi:hypothetical protein